jgi:hypothetical protein
LTQYFMLSAGLFVPHPPVQRGYLIFFVAGPTGPKRQLARVVHLVSVRPFRSATVCTGWITGLEYASRTGPTRHIVDVVTRPAVGPGGPTSAIASWINVLPYASDTGPERQMRNKIGLRMVRPFLSASVAAGWIVFLHLQSLQVQGGWSMR